MAKTAAAQRKAQKKTQKQISKPCRLSAAVAGVAKRRQPPVCSLTLEREAKSFGFDANEYLKKGCTVLRGAVLSKSEVQEAREVALRIRASSQGGGGGEFFTLRDGASRDKRKLFALLHRYNPLLHQLFNGIRLPFSDKGPYSHHNQIQLAIKKPGFEGYSALSKMSNALVGHVDQTDGSKKEGKRYCNYTALFGIVLDGDTEHRNDAGNLWVAPGSSRAFATKFKLTGQTPMYVPGKGLAERYFSKAEMPSMQPVHAKPGQAILMQWQTIHGVGPNHSETDRIHVYFRLTAAHRPEGSKKTYPAAMMDPYLETPLLKELARRQR